MSTVREVRQERTHSRDTGLSDRHRLWGWDVPALDLDFLEYDLGHPTALIEYYHANGRPKNMAHPNMRALAKLGTMAGLPVFVVRYSSDFQHWWVIGANDQAKRIVGEGSAFNTETDYVAWLYDLRGRKVPTEITEQLRKTA